MATRRPTNKVRTAGLAVACLAVLGTSSEAQAGEYGCKVLLCLANPSGPTAVSQCVPPIRQLWRDLANRRPFPSCDEARPAHAVQNTSHYDVCPAGTSALPAGQNAALGPVFLGSVFAGIGDGDGVTIDPERNPSLGRKVCVAGRLGETTVQVGEGESISFVSVTIYNQVAILDPHGSPQVIDVYLNGQLYRRVRW